MGVLTDGLPYLTLRGLARLCGVEHTLIIRLAQGWNSPDPRPREAKIKKNLADQGVFLTEPYIRVMHEGVAHHAFPDVACMAVLEYYAFDPNSPSRKIAIEKFRLLARRSFKDFIYTQLGYDADAGVPIRWRQFLDRVALVHDEVPPGDACVFEQIAAMVVTLIQHDGHIDHRFVPDISVGNTWATHWKAEGFDTRCGLRQTYSHSCPDYFPQASSNPQAVFCYPDLALAEFKRWLREVYLPKKFPFLCRAKSRMARYRRRFQRSHGERSGWNRTSLCLASSPRQYPHQSTDTGAAIASPMTPWTCRPLSTRR
jgi:hypothetical protein